MLPPMETPTEDTEQEPQGEGSAPRPASDVEAYESEWYEVLKRRAEELEAEGDEAEDDEEGDDA